jgi:hypothetical protein
MAKMKLNRLRSILAEAGDIIAEYDANKAGESGGEDGAGSGLGAKTLMEQDQPQPQDEEGPPEFPGKPKYPATNGNQLAASDSGLLMRRMMDNAPARDALDTRTPKGLHYIPNSPGRDSLRSLEEKIAADTKAKSDALFK